jgi:hypothetical protein
MSVPPRLLPWGNAAEGGQVMTVVSPRHRTKVAWEGITGREEPVRNCTYRDRPNGRSLF